MGDRALHRLLILLGATALFFWLFWRVFFQDHQFAFRDATHHYYPLYLRVQQEWSAGRLPLWNPWENGGTPLLGNPTAAVLYPLKVIFALLPYAWAMRLFVSVHVVIAFLGMYLFLRRSGRSDTGSALGAFGYGFGGPILLLFNNVIYLVGAAWIPWVFWASFRYLEDRRPIDLAMVTGFLAFQLLGGEPQAAYLSWLGCMLVAFVFDKSRRTASQRVFPDSYARAARFLGMFALLVLLGLVSSWLSPTLRTRVGIQPYTFTLLRLIHLGLICLLGLALVSAHWRKVAWAERLLPLLGAGLLAACLAAVYVLPVAENLIGSTRGEKHVEPYGFSLVPYRVAELLVPGIFGQSFPQNYDWKAALPPRNEPGFWVPSLYQGGLTLCLAFLALGSGRSRSAKYLFFLTVGALSVSCGYYLAPGGFRHWLFWPDWRDFAQKSPVSVTVPISGDGSPYALLTLLIPGLDLFRYPSKALTWFAFGVATLSAQGWDKLSEEGSRERLRRWIGVVCVAMVLCLGIVQFNRSSMIAWGVGSGRSSQQTGPFEPGLAWESLRNGVLHAAIVVFTLSLILRLHRYRPVASGAVLVVATCVDLAVAHQGLIWTVPQSIFEERPEVIGYLENSTGGQRPPIRIHRPPVWYPFGWYTQSSSDRLEVLAEWERRTLQPLHGLPENLAYSLTLGIMESARYLAMFRPWMLPAGPKLGPQIGLEPEEPVLHFPRRAFDMWGTDYFLLPVLPGDWRHDSRANASFLQQTSLVFPQSAVFQDQEKDTEWRRDQDWQLLKNRTAQERAWIVHQVQVIPNLDRLDEAQRQARIRTLLFQNDALWNAPDRPVLDLKEMAWVESDDPTRDRPSVDLVEPVLKATESVSFVSYTPNFCELSANLIARGLVVISEVEASGWVAEIDGKPQKIWRTNLGMRGVVVPAGKHRLTFRYFPQSLWWGAMLSMLGLAILMWCLIGHLIFRRKRGVRIQDLTDGRSAVISGFSGGGRLNDIR